MTPSEKETILCRWCRDFHISHSLTGRVYGMIWCAQFRTPRFTQEYLEKHDMIDEAYKIVKEYLWDDICLL